jgi:hypothetical protein
MNWVTFATPAIAKLFPLSVAMSLFSLGNEFAQPLWCDGVPPKLINRDDREHSFKVACRKKSADRRIGAGETQSLLGKPGCVLMFGDQSVTLYVDLVCVIRNSKLSCELS